MYRSDEPKSPSDFVARARNEVSTFYRNALAANTVRLEKYLEKYHKDEVMNSESLQKEDRSLLNIRSEIKGALVSAETGHPLIFGLDVQAPKDKLSQTDG